MKIITLRKEKDKKKKGGGDEKSNIINYYFDRLSWGIKRLLCWGYTWQDNRA